MITKCAGFVGTQKHIKGSSWLFLLSITICRKLLFRHKRIILTFKKKPMYRYLFRFAVMTITLLTVNLITNAITNYLVSYKNHYKPVTFTLIAMAIIVVILYPLFIKLESWVKILSVKAIKTGKSAAGKFFGLFFTFLASLLVLLYFYTKMWYHINLFHLLIP
jgi:hypothetical protein